MTESTWMQQRREDAALTQLEVASRLQTSTGDPWDQSKVSRYEAAPDKAPLGGILAMLQVLGVQDPLAFLTGRPQDMGHGVDAGTPLAALHRDLAALRFYIESKDWQSPSPSVTVPIPNGLKVLIDGLAQKPQVAFFGKFDVGKSTLVNTILGAKSMPTAFQPTTKVVTYVRHLTDRPNWLKEEVLMLGSGFDPKEWTDKDHCLIHKVVAGGLETLQSFGTHRGEKGGSSEATYALVFVDSPVLNSCSIIDLPGTENDTTDTKRATSQQIAYDVAVFADTVTGFLGEGSLLRLGEVIRGLPTLESADSPMRPLSNLFVVATHAHRGITDQQIREEILPGGQFRAWRQLGDTAMKSRGGLTGVEISRQDFEDRFFPYYPDLSERRDDMLSDLQRLLEVDLPSVLKLRAAKVIERFKQESTAELQSTIEFYQSTIDDRAAVEQEIAAQIEAEPRRVKAIKDARQAVESSIVLHRVEMRDDLRKYIQNLTEPERIESLIRKDFPKKKDAQHNAAPFVCEQIQSHFENEALWRTEEVSKLIADFIGEYDLASMKGPAKPGHMGIPFNANGAFAGGLVGLAAVGGLALWASTLGNLGAYIIVAQTVSVLSALGISTGGTAVWMSAVASIGGPVTLAIGIVVLAGVLGWAVLRGSWEGRLAKKISTELRKSQIESNYTDRADQYWNETAAGFAAGAFNVEDEWKTHLQQMRQIIEETDLAGLRQRLARLKELHGVFLGLPWGPTVTSSVGANWNVNVEAQAERHDNR